MVTFLFILFVLLMAFGAAYMHFKNKDLEALLHINPPETSWFSCALPGDFSGSEERMSAFYSKLTDICATSVQDRQAGQGVIHLGFYAENKHVGHMPEAMFVVGCSPEIKDKIKTALNTAYGLDLVLSDLPAYPLADELEVVRLLNPVQRPFAKQRAAWEERKVQTAAAKMAAEAHPEQELPFG